MKCATWFLLLLAASVILKQLIADVFSDVFEQMEDMFSEYDDSYEDEEYDFGVRKKKKVLKKV